MKPLSKTASDNLVFLIGLPIIAFYFIPFIIYMKLNIALTIVHDMILGTDELKTPGEKRAGFIFMSVSIGMGVVVFGGWTLLFLAILIGHPIRW